MSAHHHGLRPTHPCTRCNRDKGRNWEQEQIRQPASAGCSLLCVWSDTAKQPPFDPTRATGSTSMPHPMSVPPTTGYILDQGRTLVEKGRPLHSTTNRCWPRHHQARNIMNNNGVSNKWSTMVRDRWRLDNKATSNATPAEMNQWMPPWIMGLKRQTNRIEWRQDPARLTPKTTARGGAQQTSQCQRVPSQQSRRWWAHQGAQHLREANNDCGM